MKIKKTTLLIIILLAISLILNIYFFFELSNWKILGNQEGFTFKSNGMSYDYMLNQIDLCKNTLCTDYDSCAYSIHRKEDREFCCLYKFDHAGEVLIPPSECILLPRE